MRERPQPDPEKLDFSLFHPLDHYIWEERCQEFYGGPKRHIQLWWEFIGSHWLHEHTTCKLGIHTYTQYWSRSSYDSDDWSTGFSCVYCLKERD